MAVKRGGLGKGLDSMIPVLDSTATKKKTGRTAIDKEALQNAAKEAQHPFSGYGMESQTVYS